MSTPARQGYRFRGARQLANAIEQHQREVRTAGCALGGKLSEDERTQAQTALRNAEANLSTARWELQRQERADMIPGLDTSRAGVPDQLHEPLCIGRYTHIERGGLRLTGEMTQRLGRAYAATRKEVEMRHEITLSELAAVVGKSRDVLYTAIRNGVLTTAQYSGDDSKHYVELAEARRYVASLRLSEERRVSVEAALHRAFGV